MGLPKLMLKYCEHWGIGWDTETLGIGELRHWEHWVGH